MERQTLSDVSAGSKRGSALRALLADVIDYAGLFPPASLGMAETVRNYAAYLRRDDAWALSRLIIPASRLEEFDRAAAEGGVLPTAADAEPWRISALVCDDVEADLERIAAFNDRHGDPSVGAALVDAVEVKAESTSRIDAVLDAMPEWLDPFFEIPAKDDVRGLVAALVGGEAAAKIRTGGVTAAAIPSCAEVAGFISACAQAGVPFKATAGLHHPIRAEHRLTYAPDSPSAVMHGFLNVFLGAALAFAGRIDRARLEALLDERSSAAFSFDDNSAAWRDLRVSTEQLAKSRERFALSFGSCSFTEPMDDLLSLGLLPPLREGAGGAAAAGMHSAQ